MPLSISLSTINKKIFNMKIKAISLLFSVFALSSAFAQPKLVEKVDKEAGKLIIPYEKYVLNNGLTVILHEDKSDPIVHIDVTYHVGSARETPGKSGFAHFFEHMMFQGSDNVADDEHFKIVQSAGGDMNGTTNRDRTNYFETLPANYLETGLWLEADRMGFLLDAVTKKSFENQRSTVKNEKGQNYLSRPYGTLGEVTDQNLYPSGHPYSWPTIGFTDDLDRADENDLKNFFLRWYGPNNAILTIAGDFEKEKTLELVEKYFGGIKQGPAVKKQVLPPPVIANDKYSTIEDQIFLPLTQFVFPSIPNYHRDEAALDMLASIMGGGNNSVFYRNFIKSEKAIQAEVFNPCFELSGEFSIIIVAYPDQTLEDTEKLIRETLNEFESDVLKGSGIGELLAQSKAEMKTQIISGMESVAGKAAQLASWHYLLGRPYNVQDDLDRYDAVTVEDLNRVFAKYIKNKKAVITNVVQYIPKPGENMEDFEKASFNPFADKEVALPAEYEGLTYVKAADKFDRSKRPQPTEPRPAVVPNFYRSKLANGIDIIGTQTTEVPMVGMMINIRGGHIMDDNGFQDGTAVLTGLMMMEGTEKYTTEEFGAALKKLGTFLNISGGPNATTISMQCVQENVDASVALLEEALMRPRFSPEDFKRVKKQLLESIKDQRTNPDLIASKAFTNLMYGNTVLGRFYTGTYESVDKIKLEDVKSFYEKNFSPNITNVIIVGSKGEDEMIAKMQFLNKWENKNVEIPKITAFPQYEGPQILLIDKPAAPQSQLRIGYLANPYDYNGIFFKTNIMNFPLGGNFSSRINMNLREDKGFTYGARSGFSGSEYPGPFVASASVRTSSTDSSITEIMKEINNYKEKGISDEELEFTKSSILLSDILNYESSWQKGAFLDRIVRYDLPNDFVAQQQSIVNKMTKEEINALAKEHLKTEKMIILVVGNSYVVKKRLEKLGYGKVKELDATNINLKEFKL